jgi:translation initiation factor IF-1
MRLANGHEFLGFRAGRARAGWALQAGQALRVQFTPFDLSTARILEEQTTI